MLACLVGWSCGLLLVEEAETMKSETVHRVNLTHTHKERKSKESKARKQTHRPGGGGGRGEGGGSQRGVRGCARPSQRRAGGQSLRIPLLSCLFAFKGSWIYSLRTLSWCILLNFRCRFGISAATVAPHAGSTALLCGGCGGSEEEVEGLLLPLSGLAPGAGGRGGCGANGLSEALGSEEGRPKPSPPPSSLLVLAPPPALPGALGGGGA